MPQSAKEKNDHEIQASACIRDAVSAERDIQIIPEPAGQGDVPAAPKIPEGLGDVGVIKILKKLEAEHLSQPHGHVRVTGKVEIDLQGVADRPKPGIRRGQLAGRQRENLVCGECNRVGDEDFFGQSHYKTADSPGKLLQAVLTTGQLRSDGMPPQNGSGNKLREEEDV